MEETPEIMKEKDISSVMTFYVKMYSERVLKDLSRIKKINAKEKKCVHREALKSWECLQAKEKEVIQEKYMVYLNQCKNKYAEYLKNMEPYLKKKPLYLQLLEEKNASIHSDHNIINDSNIEAESSRIEDDNNMEVDAISFQQNISESIPKELDNQPQTLPEPIPPSFRSISDLYMIVQSEDNETGSAPWSALTRTQKKKYQIAIEILKKEYINNYIQYLNSLPSIELYRLLHTLDT